MRSYFLYIQLAITLLSGTVSGFVSSSSSAASRVTTTNDPITSSLHMAKQQTPLQQDDDRMTTTSSSASSSAIAVASHPSLSPLESWCIIHMELWYSRSLSIKCPFFRRRMADLLDATDMVMRFLVIRHKSLDLIGPPPGCRNIMINSSSSNKHQNSKNTNLSIETLRETIRKDWKEDTHKGYYITGRLNTTIYRDDCLFDGPDPDMPVRGLRKYLNAASHLFDHAKSHAELLSLDVVDNDDDDNDNDDGKKNEGEEFSSSSKIVARWKLRGVLHLPWRPQLPVWTGSTTYHFDNDGLIYLHEESWDISVLEAFTETLFPDVAHKIWNKRYDEEDDSENRIIE